MLDQEDRRLIYAEAGELLGLSSEAARASSWPRFLAWRR
jgi:hypothetical protein